MASLLETLKGAANAVGSKLGQAAEYIGKPVLDTYNAVTEGKTSKGETVGQALSKAPERIGNSLLSSIKSVAQKPSSVITAPIESGKSFLGEMRKTAEDMSKIPGIGKYLPGKALFAYSNEEADNDKKGIDELVSSGQVGSLIGSVAKTMIDTPIASHFAKPLIGMVVSGKVPNANEGLNIVSKQVVGIMGAIQPVITGLMQGAYTQTGLDKALAEANDNISKSIHKKLKPLGVSEEDASTAVDTVQNILGSIAGGLGGKYEAAKGGVKGFAGNVAIQSAPDVATIVASEALKDKKDVGKAAGQTFAAAALGAAPEGFHAMKGGKKGAEPAPLKIEEAGGQKAGKILEEIKKKTVKTPKKPTEKQLQARAKREEAAKMATANIEGKKKVSFADPLANEIALDEQSAGKVAVTKATPDEVKAYAEAKKSNPKLTLEEFRSSAKESNKGISDTIATYRGSGSQGVQTIYNVLHDGHNIDFESKKDAKDYIARAKKGEVSAPSDDMMFTQEEYAKSKHPDTEDMQHTADILEKQTPIEEPSLLETLKTGSKKETPALAFNRKARGKAVGEAKLPKGTTYVKNAKGKVIEAKVPYTKDLPLEQDPGAIDMEKPKTLTPRPEYETGIIDKAAVDKKRFGESNSATKLYIIFKDKTSKVRERIEKSFASDMDFQKLKTPEQKAKYVDSKLYPTTEEGYRIDTIIRGTPTKAGLLGQYVFPEFRAPNQAYINKGNANIEGRVTNSEATMTGRKSVEENINDTIRSKLEGKVEDPDSVMDDFMEFADKSKTLQREIKSIGNRMKTGKYDDKAQQRMIYNAYMDAYSKFVNNNKAKFRKSDTRTDIPAEGRKPTKGEKFVKKVGDQADKKILKDSKATEKAIEKANKELENLKNQINKIKSKASAKKDAKTIAKKEPAPAKDMSEIIKKLESDLSKMTDLAKLQKKLENMKLPEKKKAVQARIDQVKGGDKKVPAETKAQKSKSDEIAKLQKEVDKIQKEIAKSAPAPEGNPLPDQEAKPAIGENPAKGKKIKIKKGERPVPTTNIGSAGDVISNAKLGKDTEFETAPGTGLMKLFTLGNSLNADTYLNNIRIKIGGQFAGTFSKFVQGAKNIGKQVANKLISDYKVKESADRLLANGMFKKDYDNVMGKLKDALLNQKDSAGNKIVFKTPIEGADITSKNFHILENTLSQYDKFDVSGTYGHLYSGKDVADLNRLLHAYHILRARPEGQKLFSPEFREIADKMIDDMNMMTKDTGKYMAESGDLKEYMIDENYMRKVLTSEGRKELEKRFGKKLPDQFMTADGKKFDSLLEMQAYLRSKKRYSRSGKTIGPDTDTANFISILKEASEGLDMFRLHSPLAQSLDYARSFGDMQKLNTIFDAFGKVTESKGKGMEEHTKGMYGNNLLDNVLENAINISSESKSKSLKYLVDKPVELGVKAVMLGGLDSIVQAVTAGSLKMAALGRNPLSAISFLSKDITPETKNILQQYGITQHFELGGLKGLAGNSAVSFFGGTPVENAQKAMVAKPIIQEAVKLAGKDAPEDYNELMKIFDEVMTKADIGTRTAIMDTIYDAINYIGNMTSAARSRVTPFRRLGFSALKSFDTNMIGQFYQNMQKVLTGVESNTKTAFGKKIGTSKYKEMSKLLTPIAAYYAIAQMYAAASENDDDKELLYERGKEMAQKFIGNPLVNMYGYIGNQISNIGNVPYDFAVEAVNNLMAFAKMDPKLAAASGLNNMMSFLLKRVQAGQDVDYASKMITGKSAQQRLSEALGLPNRERMTKSLNATGFGTDTGMEALGRLIGINNDAATQNFIYRELKKAEAGDSDPITQAVKSWAQSNYNSIKRGFSEGFYNIPGVADKMFGKEKYVDSIAAQNYAATVLQHRDGNATLGDFLAKAGLGKDIEKMADYAVRQKTGSMHSENVAMERFIKEALLMNSLKGNTFSEKLDDLEQKNPKLFNDFIAGISKTKRQMDNGEFTKNPRLMAEALQRNMKSDTAIDAAIASVTMDAPLSTAIGESFDRAMQEMKTSAEGSEGVTAGKKSLDRLEKFFKTMSNTGKYTNGIARSIALKSMELKGLLEDMKQGMYDNLPKDYPNVAAAIKDALILRGEIDGYEQQPATPEYAGSESDTSSSSLLNNLKITGIAPKKEQPVKNLLEQDQEKIRTPQKLLSDKQTPSSGSLLEEVLRNRSQTR